MLDDGRGDAVDLIVTSGGVSAGAYEVVKDALTGQGIEFAKVAMQPGMPQGAGRYAGVPIVTLPGNPVSSYVSFEVFLRPAIRAAMGHPDITRPIGARSRWPPRSTPRPASGSSAAGTWTPSPAPSRRGGAGSHLLSWLAGADCMFVIAEDDTHLDAGTDVEVWLLS